MVPEKIRKRDGRIVAFNPERIANAIFKAARAVGGQDYELAVELAREVTALVGEKYGDRIINMLDTDRQIRSPFYCHNNPPLVLLITLIV